MLWLSINYYFFVVFLNRKTYHCHYQMMYDGSIICGIDVSNNYCPPHLQCERTKFAFTLCVIGCQIEHAYYLYVSIYGTILIPPIITTILSRQSFIVGINIIIIILK